MSKKSAFVSAVWGHCCCWLAHAGQFMTNYTKVPQIFDKSTKT
jgi:hypothetical protein